MTPSATRSQRDWRGRRRGRVAAEAEPASRPPTDSALTRGPSMPRIAGRKVRPKITEASTTIAPPRPIELRALARNHSSPDSPIATAMPENRTALPAVPDGALDGLLDRPAARELLAESARDEERVVDREREPEHRRDVQDVDAHLGLAGEEPDEPERGRDRKARHEERHAGGDERGEDEDQHERGDRQRDGLGAL